MFVRMIQKKKTLLLRVYKPSLFFLSCVVFILFYFADRVRKRIHFEAGGHVQGHRPQPRSHDGVLSALEDQARRSYGLQAGQEQGDGPTRAGEAAV